MKTPHLILATLALATSQLLAASQSNSIAIRGNTPGFIKQAVDKGPAKSTDQITITAWLQLHNENKLTQLLRDQSSKGSSSYHKWLTQDQFNTNYSPKANEANAVQNFLAAHNLTVLYVAENNFYVKAQGSIADVQKAFHVEIHQYSYKGATYRSNTGDPSVNDSNGGLIAAVTGMDDMGYEPMVQRGTDAKGQPAPFVPLSRVPDGFFFEGHCFAMNTETHTFTSTNPPVTATYSGNRFGADITNENLGHFAPCGYQPSEIYKAYNMGPVFQAGYNGAGETIVIVDAYGSAQIADEADVFSQIYGLPRITSSNFQQLRAPGAVHNTSPHFGGGSLAWHDEIALDVEWSHAMAPGAKIVLVVGPNNTSDLDEAINYAVVHHLGNTISNSWGSIEGFGNPAQLNRMNRILMSAAAQGIDVNFSTGDFGDYEPIVGFKTVGFPASSPFATAIGGTSLFLNDDNTIKFQTGWGTNETRIAGISPSSGQTTDDNPPVDPPLRFGFIFGAGGGSSLTFPKPSWQASLPGTTRQLPDISLFADPFTGAEIISTDLSTGELVVGVIGGTSLSCPAFSGIMADAAQKHGHVGFGQVAPLLYNLPAAAITDVPGSFAASATNVAGSITDSNGTTAYSADDLAGPLDGVTNYVSAFYNSPFSTRYFVLTFGTDTSLKTATGWDNVTGLGTPNGAAFVNAIAP